MTSDSSKSPTQTGENSNDPEYLRAYIAEQMAHIGEQNDLIIAYEGRLKSYRALRESAKATDSYWVGVANLDFALSIGAALSASGMSEDDLAVKLEQSAEYVKLLLRGDLPDLTIQEMVLISKAVGMKLLIGVIHSDDIHSASVKD